MMVYPEFESISDTLESDCFWLDGDGIADSACENGYIVAIYELECSDKERNHILY